MPSETEPKRTRIARYALTVLARLISLFVSFRVGEHYGLWAGIACFFVAWLMTTIVFEVLLERYGGERSEDPWEDVERRDPRNAAAEIGLMLGFALVPVAGIAAAVFAGREFGLWAGMGVGVAILVVGWYLLGVIVARMMVIEGRDGS